METASALDRERDARGSRLAPADRRDHVDPGTGLERGLERRSLPVDVDVDVPAKHGSGLARTGLAQSVSEARPALFEEIERLVDRGGLELEVARQPREERPQRRGEIDLGHAQSTIATSTDAIPGR
jgi:hypothetical protein